MTLEAITEMQGDAGSEVGGRRAKLPSEVDVCQSIRETAVDCDCVPREQSTVIEIEGERSVGFDFDVGKRQFSAELRW